MSQRTEQRHDEFAQWFEANFPRHGVDPEKRWQFLVKVIQNLAAINAMLISDLQKLEGGGSRLWLPGALQVSGDLKRFG